MTIPKCLIKVQKVSRSWLLIFVTYKRKIQQGGSYFFSVSCLMSTERPLSNEFSFVLGFAAGSFNMFFLQQLQKSNSPKLLNKFGLFWTVPYLHSIEIGNNIYIAKRGRGIETKKKIAFLRNISLCNAKFLSHLMSEILNNSKLNYLVCKFLCK